MKYSKLRQLVGLLGVLGGAACSPDQTKELGQVADCGNGRIFSLESGDCRTLVGHNLLSDGYGFERVQVSNGITVPRQINGSSPFYVLFSYDVSRRAAFDVVVKRVEYGKVLGDNYSNWEKVYVEAGQGEVQVRLSPKDGKPMPAAKAANFVEGSWQGEMGYIVEVQGGDRFEDEDADAIKLWRAAGIEVNPAAPDDPEGKVFILGELQVAEALPSCSPVSGQLQLLKTAMDLTVVIGLKDPGNNWLSWGETILKLAKGSKGPHDFSFATQNAENICPPPGEKVQIEPWRADPGQYIIQMDVYDHQGNKLNLDDPAYESPRTARGIQILPAAATALNSPAAAGSATEAASQPISPTPSPSPVAATAAAAKIFSLGAIQPPSTVQSCGEVKVAIELLSTEIDLSLSLALKQPADNWLSWGGQTLEVPAGTREKTLIFSFKAQDEQGKCAPPGAAVAAGDAAKAKSGQYLIQLDIFDSAGKKYDDAKSETYSFIRNSVGVKVGKAR